MNKYIYKRYDFYLMLLSYVNTSKFESINLFIRVKTKSFHGLSSSLGNLL